MKAWGLILFLLLGLSSPALASDVIWFRILRFSGELKSNYGLYNEERTVLGNQLYTNMEEKLEAGLSFSSEGYVIHPKFLEFHLTANYKENKGTLEKNSQQSNFDYNNNTHDFLLRLFKHKPVALELYSLETFGVTDRAFYGTLASANSKYGVRLVSRSKYLGFILNAYNYESKQDSISSSLRQENQDIIELRMSVFNTQHSKMQLRYKYLDYHELLSQTEYNAYNGQIEYRLKYGPSKKNRLFSTIYDNRYVGDFDFTNRTIRTGNTYYFRKNFFLDSTYNYTLSRNANIEQSIHKQENTLTHELFESLYSSVSFSGEKLDTFNQKVSKLDGRARIRYKKNFPTGQIWVSLEQGLEQGKYESNADVIRHKEMLDFSLIDIVTLGFSGIQISSIEVWSQDLSTPYVRGLDYELMEIDGMVSIIRLVEGQIPEGSKVNVFYDHHSFPDQSVDRLYEGQFIQLQFFKYLYFTWMNNEYRHEMDSLYAVSPFENRRTRRTSYKFESSFAEIKYTDESVKSNISPHDTQQTMVSFRGDIVKGLRASINYQFGKTMYPNQDIRNENVANGADIIYRPFPSLSINVTYRYSKYDRLVADSALEQRRENESLILFFKWNFNQLAIDLRYEDFTHQYDQNEMLRDRFFVRIRRRF